MKENIIKTRTFNFALKIVESGKCLTERQEYINKQGIVALN